MGLYERLLDLATRLGELDGHWGESKIAGNLEERKKLELEYTPDEIKEAQKIMLKQLTFSDF